MLSYHAQIARIKSKLPQAQTADSQYKVFGADGHRYQMAGPLSASDLLALEQRYNISLPADYRLFMQEIGPGAGPFYGLYDPRQHAAELVTNPQALGRPSHWRPDMSDEEWAALMLPFEADDMSNAAFEQAVDSLFAGLLPLGTQGCTYYHALVVSGEYRGRVVNLDEERNPPKFTYETNFLDWYERWLDEILDGTLLREGPTWFGYQRGGTEAELLAGFRTASTPEQQREYLVGLTRLLTVSPVTLDQLVQVYANATPEVSQQALQCLTQFDYSRARPLLRALWPSNPLQVAKLVYRFAETQADDWLTEIKAILKTANSEPELFRFISYLAKQCTTDLSPLLEPFVAHTDSRINKQAAYILQEIAKQQTIWQRLLRFAK